MGVDEARDDDVAGGVDDLGVGCRDVLADLDDLAVLDEHIGVRQLADRRVLGTRCRHG